MSDLSLEDEHDEYDRAMYNLIQLGFVSRTHSDDGTELYEITETGSAYFELTQKNFRYN